jgi:hypothetical protein
MAVALLSAGSSRALAGCVVGRTCLGAGTLPTRFSTACLKSTPSMNMTRSIAPGASPAATAIEDSLDGVNRESISAAANRATPDEVAPLPFEPETAFVS